MMMCKQQVSQQLRLQKMWFDDSNKKQFIKITEKSFLERYELIESLGRGNSGEVFKARSAHGNLVAIKQFRSQAMQQFHMIIREISNLKKLDHPNILKFYDCYIVDDYKYYMVTEFCQGGALTDFISQVHNQRGKMTLCQQMAEGLAYAHSQGIVHRDLKPENILIGQRNVAKIGDFGCSTQLDDRADSLTSRVGSPAYMDYRVGRRQEYDHTADLYSLGMVYMWVFEGKGIYDECKSLTDLNHHQSQISRDYENSIQAYIQRLPTPIDAIVKNCLSPDYRSRYSAEAIATMIAARISQDKSSTNLISTQDELEEVENERMQFAYRLMSLNKDFERRYRSERILETLLRLLSHNQKALEKIKQLSQMRYVCLDTKAQFTFLVYLYYLSWLRQIGFAVQGEPSEVGKRYSEIDAKAIELDRLRVVEKYLGSEQERVSTALLKHAQKIQGTLHLISKDKYLPAHFREFVRAAYQQESLPFSHLQEKEHLANVAEFFKLRVQVEYDYSRGKDGEHDPRIEVMREISRSFQ